MGHGDPRGSPPPPPGKRPRLHAPAAADAAAAAAATLAAAAAGVSGLGRPHHLIDPRVAALAAAGGPASSAAAAAAAAAVAPQPASSLDALSYKQRAALVRTDSGRQALAGALDAHTQCLVECGTAIGLFSLVTERVHCLCPSCGEQPEARSNMTAFLPSEFERHAGMAACKKWRFSIKVGFVSLLRRAVVERSV